MRGAPSPGNKPSFRAKRASGDTVSRASIARRRTARLGTGIASALIGLGVLAASVSAQEPWGFEQVTPVEKGDGAVSYLETFRSADDGHSFLYTTQTPFSSVPTESVGVLTRYLGERGDDGWTNRAVDPPFDQTPFDKPKLLAQATIRASENLHYALVATTVGLTPEAIEGGSNLYIRDMRTGDLQHVASHPNIEMVDVLTTNYGDQNAIHVAPDGKSAVFATHVALSPDAPQDLPMTDAGIVYKWTENDGIESVSVLPESQGGDTVSAVYPGFAEFGTRQSRPVKGHLQYLHFQIPSGQTGPLYVREGGVSRLVSYSRRAEDDPSQAVDVGTYAIGDGGRYSIFQAPRPLTDDTPIEGAFNTYLYRHDASDDSLMYIGQAEGSLNLRVEEMSRDGQTIVFQSDSALDDGASPGASNLYVWRSGELQFVNTFAPGAEPTLGGTYWIRRLSENGRYFAFTDDSATTAGRFGIDNTSAKCPAFGAPGLCDVVYVYDSVASELSCASCRDDQGTPKGHAGDPDTGNYGHMMMDTHARQFVTNDGTVFFATEDDLLPEDVNGEPDVYAYHDGAQRLITRATQGVSYSRFLEVTPNGEAVFFATNDAIAATDNDEAVDVYATGPDFGFDYTPPDITPPCQGAECREQTDPMPLLPPTGSIDFEGGGNPDKAGKVVVHRAGKLEGTKIRLRIDVPSAGKLAIGGNKLRNKRKSVAEAGSYRISTSLNNKGRKKLKRKRQLRVPVRVRFNPESGSASAMRFAVAMKANSKRKGR